jgi:hypothetical protein
MVYLVCEPASHYYHVMTSSDWLPATCALIAVALLVSAGAPSPRAAGEAAVDKKAAVLLKISDLGRGLSLEAKKRVAKDTNAFDFVRHTVAVAYRTQASGGPTVTSFCGVNPGKDTRWLSYLDGERCKAIGQVMLKADAKIEWKTEAN